MRELTREFSQASVETLSMLLIPGDRRRFWVCGTETRHAAYSIAGDLMPEYAANASASSPQKEYGYLNGPLLIEAEPLAQETPTASPTSTPTPNPTPIATQTPRYGFVYRLAGAH